MRAHQRLPAVCLGTLGLNTPGAWIDWFRGLGGQAVDAAPAARLFAVDDPFPAFRCFDHWHADDPRVRAMVLNVMREAVDRGNPPRDGRGEHLAAVLRRFARDVADGVALDAGITRRPIPADEAGAIVKQWLRDRNASAALAVENVMDGALGSFSVRDGCRDSGYDRFKKRERVRSHWIVNLDDAIRFDGPKPGRVSYLVDKWTGEVSPVPKLVQESVRR